ncbi:MAG TPA: hypothetical protein P5268_09900 [Candidatus Marinimicrobia bacterium]|nr:hypothetical protein [Candidatus Neomarinimicrobiota bacterium]HRS51632.1 hypothetical protein [Candidatus Neomarinimicrobiota bacterium]HRU93325.1 hypothetical protein [Candidatus Neomarinimicrobiota bacterium]
MKKKSIFIITALVILVVLLLVNWRNHKTRLAPTSDNGEWFFLHKSDLRKGPHHTKHARIFGKYVCGYNYYILKGIDKVQAQAPEGGEYFTGLKARPPESPIGYELKIFGKSLITPARRSSFSSGATYGAFIEAMNIIFGDHGLDSLDFEHYEALRMQEIGGGKRREGVKFWGNWNARGFGSHFALVQYTGIGKAIEPKSARPGDFVNIVWKKGGETSAIFLGWIKSKDDKKKIAYWSSQKETNGFGDQIMPVENIKNLKLVRVINPENLFDFNIDMPVNTKVVGDKVEF